MAEWPTFREKERLVSNPVLALLLPPSRSQMTPIAAPLQYRCQDGRANVLVHPFDGAEALLVQPDHVRT